MKETMTKNHRNPATSNTQAASTPRFSTEAIILLSMGLLIAAVATIRFIQ
jgi:hypothetical protein